VHAQNPPTSEQLRFFETKIRPLLTAHCYKCHGPGKERGALRLDSRAGIFKGGASGPAILPGDPDKSLLIKAVRRHDDKLKMPPSKALADDEIADLVRWVRTGAVYPLPASSEQPSATAVEKPGDFWAFKPVASPAIPSVKDTAWPRSPLDRFVLAQLEAKGLKPAAPADPRTLIRRATFDLTGLPPTPDDIDAFLADRSPGAFAKVVDRLLASPAYGERWGRHWLDVVRYADSNGQVDGRPYPDAWRYRNYVIASFNQDKGYDRFLLEQLAGDLLPDDDHRCEDPTKGRTKGRSERLIATGFLALGSKNLYEDDKAKLQMDIVAEQIDTLGRAFMGLTLGCARCHDHKFDPISMDDYYGLAGIFKSTRTMATGSAWHEYTFPWPKDLPAIKLDYEKALAQKRAEFQEVVRQADRDTVVAALLPSGKFVLQFFAGFIQIGHGMPRASGFLECLHECVDKLLPESPAWEIWLLAAISIPAGLRLLQWRRTPHGEKLLALLKYVGSGVLLALIVAELLSDRSRLVVPGTANPDPQKLQCLEVNYPESTKDRLKALRTDLCKLEAQAPPLPAAMGVAEGQVADAPINLRGSHLNLGETVPRRVPKIMAGRTAPSFSATQSGRLELARWLVHVDHPLTSRVMVNRIWRWHFGYGMVRTPDNFGRAGERADNPALLDWLARRFVESGWSIKAMHRTIMLTSTYQMSSEPDAANADYDPENRLLGRANIRRLEVEAIRDAILAVSGTLDRTREEVTPIVTTEALRNIYQSPRRTVYLAVYRNNLYDMCQLFDFPDPAECNGDRASTTVAPQALFFLNNEWVGENCQSFADRLLANRNLDDAERVRRAYLEAYGREPTGEDTAKSILLVLEVERALAERVADAGARRRQAWAALCQAIMAANEFVYVK